MTGAVNAQLVNQKVTSRKFTFLDLVTRAWGSEFHEPDHNVYRFSNGRGYDSTDQSQGGPYSKTHP